MAKDKCFVGVPCISKDGISRGVQLLNINNILYLRQWSIDNAKNDETKSVAYMVGGKEIVIDMLLIDLMKMLPMLNDATLNYVKTENPQT